MLVGGEQDFLSIRGERGSEAGAAKIGDSVGIAAIAVSDDDFHFHGSGEIIGKQRFVARQIVLSLGIMGAPHELLPVAGKYRAAIIAYLVRDLLLVRTVRLHGPK